MINWAKDRYVSLNGKYPAHTKVLRYIISGGTSTFVNLALLYVLTELFGLWYIASASVSFIAAFVISFVLQKYWTFQDVSKEYVHRQAIFYFVVMVVNLCINTALLYLLVEYTGIHYMLSQIISGVFIATESFFVYQFFIFKR